MQMNLSNIEKKPNFWRTLSYLDSIAKKTILNETGDAMLVFVWSGNLDNVIMWLIFEKLLAYQQYK